MEEKDMKKTYDSMEAYKVTFNANEQVAAACGAYDSGSKYSVPSNGLTICDLDEAGAKYVAMTYKNCFFTDDGCESMGISTKYQD